MSPVRPLISQIRKMKLEARPPRIETAEMPVDNLEALLAQARGSEEGQRLVASHLGREPLRADEVELALEVLCVSASPSSRESTPLRAGEEQRASASPRPRAPTPLHAREVPLEGLRAAELPRLEAPRAARLTPLPIPRTKTPPELGLLWAPIAPPVFDPRAESTRVERAPVISGTPIPPSITPTCIEAPLLELDDPAKPLRVATPLPRARPITPVAQPTISDARPRPIIERDARSPRAEWKKHERHLAPAIALLAFCSLGFSVVDLALSAAGMFEPPSGMTWWLRTAVSFFAGAVACAWSLVRPDDRVAV